MLPDKPKFCRPKSDFNSRLFLIVLISSYGLIACRFTDNGGSQMNSYIATPNAEKL